MGGVVSQSVVTRTRTVTTLETVPGTTIVTTITVEGGEKTVTLINPGFVVIGLYAESGRTCVVVFRALTEVPEQVFTITGTTMRFPGMTFSTVVNEPTIVFSTAYTDPGWTTTYTGLGPSFVTTFKVGDLEYTFSMPAYGELRETCGEQIVSNIQSIIFEQVPATFFLALPGFTVTVPGQTFTIPRMTLEMEPFTTTYTSIREGTTGLSTTTVRGSTIVTMATLPETTLVSTIVSGGSTVTRVYYVIETLTLEETTKTATTTTSVETRTTSPATTTLLTTPATTTAQAPAGQVDVTIIAIVIAAIAIVAGGVVYSLRRRR
ncbi:MAG: hypothetical protein QXM16_05210 [Nitrososphaerota archaeon]